MPTLWLRQKPGTDVAVLNGMMNVIIPKGLYAKEYVENRTEGFEALKKTVAEIHARVLSRRSPASRRRT